MDLTNKQVFKILPYVSDIYEKLEFKKTIKDLGKKNKDNTFFLGMDLIMGHILKNSGKIQKEVFNIVAIAENKSVKEVEEGSFIETIKTFKDVLDKDTLAFFKQAMEQALKMHLAYFIANMTLTIYTKQIYTQLTNYLQEHMKDMWKRRYGADGQLIINT